MSEHNSARNGEELDVCQPFECHCVRVAAAAALEILHGHRDDIVELIFRAVVVHLYARNLETVLRRFRQFGVRRCVVLLEAAVPEIVERHCDHRGYAALNAVVVPIDARRFENDSLLVCKVRQFR